MTDPIRTRVEVPHNDAPVLWVVMRLRAWEDAFEPTHAVPFPIRVSGGEGCIGFLEVYESEAAARSHYPDGPFMQIARKPDDS